MRTAQIASIFWQVEAIVFMGGGLVAIVTHKYRSDSPAMTTVHSWLGVGAVAMYGINIIYSGSLCVITSRSHIEVDIDYVLRYQLIRRCLQNAAIGLTVLALLTGIMDKMSKGFCDVSELSTTSNTMTTIYGVNFGDLPKSCKIANGLGVAVTLSAIGAVITMSLVRPRVVYDEEFNTDNQINTGNTSVSTRQLVL